MPKLCPLIAETRQDEAEEMAWTFRVLAALAEDTNLAPSSHIKCLTNYL